MVEATDKGAVESRPSHYVGIGASAGGIEAIETFFKNMPPQSGMAFIVVQHLSPNYKSLMVELLSKHTSMSVCRAEDGMTVLADHVYLIPPNRNLRIFHGKLLLSDQDRAGGLNLPIDIFFRSLAEDQGEKAIGIVLSGTGSDGTRGVRAIKEKVGMVMVQNAQSAAFDGMPRSVIETGLMDFVLAPHEMPARLVSYAQHPYVARPEASATLLSDEDGLTRIFALIRERNRVDFTHYKPSTLARRIQRRMTVNQFDALRDYVAYLEAHPGEVGHLYRDLLIGVTSFFRDSEVFELLMDRYLAPVLALDTDGGEIRFWVAGCSTGEEAYSLAMACCEVQERLDRKVNVKIFATDVDRDAIAYAGNGIYPASIAADVPPKLLSKYFYRRDEGFQIHRAVREMVVFAQHDLIRDPPFTKIHLVSCRNLLIYLQPVLQEKVLSLFNFSLARKGLLVLGSSETTGSLGEWFEPLNAKWRIYRSRGRQGLHVVSEQAAAFDGRSPRHLDPGIRLPSERRRPSDGERLLERLLQALSPDFLPFCMLVNESRQLLHLAGDPADYLRFASGRLVNDIGRLLHEDLAIPVSTGLQKAFEQGGEIVYTNVRLRDREGAQRNLGLRFRPLPSRTGQERLVAILIEPQDRAVRLPASEAPYDASAEAQQRIKDLEQELQFTRENLQATVEELETSNEELQSTNEELLASNEELQSTNEELQSVNEELHTVNTEYQVKISELSEANNDLDNLLGITGTGLLFLDENLEIRRFTESMGSVFRMVKHDLGRPFDHVAHTLREINPFAEARQVRDGGGAFEREVEDADGNSYLLRMMPYQIAPETYSGVVISLVDINPLKSIERALATESGHIRLARASTGMGTWEWNLVADRMVLSDEMFDLLGLSRDRFDGSFEAFLARVHPLDRDRVAAAARESASTATRYHVEHRVQLADGAIRWILQAGDVQDGMAGQPRRMLGLSQDVTELHEAGATSATKNPGDASAGQLLIDSSGRIITANTALERLFGYADGELVGEPVTRLMDAAHGELHGQYVDRYLQTGQSRIVGAGREVSARHRDGGAMRVHLAVMRFRVDGEDYFSGVVRPAPSTAPGGPGQPG